MSEEADHGCYGLLFDPAMSRYMLVETTTEEKLILDAGEWSLHTDDIGRSFVSRAGAGERIWCQDMLQLTIAKDNETDIVYVVFPDGEGMRLVDYQQRHRAITLPTRLPSRGKPVDIVVFVMRQSVGGVWALWSISSWYRECLGELATMSCSRWYQNWWSWWLKHLACLGMDSSHNRKPATSAATHLQPPDQHLRFLADPTMSTSAMIVLLSRWACESKSSRSKNEHAKAAWRASLQGVLQTFFSDDVSADWVIFLDLAVIARPGLPMHGSNQVLVPVRGSRVDITPVLACDELAVLQSLEAVGHIATPTALHLHDLCMMLDAAGRTCHWLFKQVVHNIACAIDSWILESIDNCSDSGRATGEPKLDIVPAESMLVGRAAGQRARKHMKMFRKYTIKAFVPASQDRRLLQYYFALRANFERVDCIHVAFDASRIGNLNRMLGFISRPDNIGAWLAPQALLREFSWLEAHKEFLGVHFIRATQSLFSPEFGAECALHKVVSRDIPLHKEFCQPETGVIRTSPMRRPQKICVCLFFLGTPFEGDPGSGDDSDHGFLGDRGRAGPGEDELDRLGNQILGGGGL